ncbi:uncharacterized protein N7459_000984 [Penicillium hispanicum]|uniref:uncharacterized protein n=1 Tax=Penicillium hispanicum TaxID=1080232 RepID=UPI0025408F45|nr:uncharacterized protein N7459_000984 [Penicillium hispanicum]KAJ5594776.1 hypothetical protein N7459_000984 [Penicillium hispanicum]
MPLHLLGKKSWNVYNPENVARVKRDEAQAKAREEEDERRMQEVDAERRIKILRGERPPTPPPPPAPSYPSSQISTRSDRKSTDDTGRHRKRRRLVGEDDTDRDIRLAREDAAQAGSKRKDLTSRRDDKDTQVPLLDSAGHINLFPTESVNKKAEKNKEAEAEAEKKRQSYEDQYTMRFSNAAGFKEQVGRQPWYSSTAQTAAAPDAMPEKNVWGNEDPLRKERERARMDANDPLAAMKRGIRQLKATEQERKRWNEEKRKELEALQTEERPRSRHGGLRQSPSIERLDDFKLEQAVSKDRDERRRRSSHRHHRDHYHRHDRSRERSRDRSYRRLHHYSARADRRRRRRDEDHDDIKGSRKVESDALREKCQSVSARSREGHD